MRKLRESDIQRTIMEHLQHSGFLVWRNNSGKIKSDRGGWMQLNVKGSPDVMALKRGILYGIEVKKPAETQTVAQGIYEEEFSKHGGRYILAWSLEDVIEGLISTERATIAVDIEGKIK